jgi:hypothetical protein
VLSTDSPGGNDLNKFPLLFIPLTDLPSPPTKVPIIKADILQPLVGALRQIHPAAVLMTQGVLFSKCLSIFQSSK